MIATREVIFVAQLWIALWYNLTLLLLHNPGDYYIPVWYTQSDKMASMARPTRLSLCSTERSLILQPKNEEDITNIWIMEQWGIMEHSCTLLAKNTIV